MEMIWLYMLFIIGLVIFTMVSDKLKQRKARRLRFVWEVNILHTHMKRSLSSHILVDWFKLWDFIKVHHIYQLFYIYTNK